MDTGFAFLFRTTAGIDRTVPLKVIVISATTVLIRIDLSQYCTACMAAGLLLCVVAADTIDAVFLIR